MFSHKTLLSGLSVLLLVSFGYWALTHGVKAEGEEPKPAKGEETAPKPPRDLEQIIQEIPLGKLEDGVLMANADIKVPLATVEKAEKDYIEGKKKENPKFEVQPGFDGYMRRHFAFRFFANQLVEKYAADNKLDVPKEKFEEQFGKFKEGIKAQGSNYEQWLQSNGLTDAEFRKVWGLNWAIEQKTAETVKEEDVNKAFDSYKDRMDSIPLRRASHILFMHKSSERVPAEITKTKEEAKAAAEATLKKLKEGGDFAEAAKANSDCPSKERGGDLDFFPRKGAMVEQFSDATYKLAKVGDITDVVETPFGFHIIKLTEMRTDENVKSQIKSQLAERKFNEQMQQIIESGVATAKFNEKLIPAAPPKLDVMPKAPEPQPKDE
jgi:hypothetical protein